MPGRASPCQDVGLPLMDGISAGAADREDGRVPDRRYRRRNPPGTILHQILRDHLESFLGRQRDRDHALPRFVERELRASLDCGDLSRGFLRVHCDGCGDDLLVAISCKSRAACPSCANRRMEDGAAFLIEHVLPDVPYRQWVMSFPRRLRLALALDAALTTRVLTITLRAIFAWQRRRARRLGWRRTRTGSVTFIQRFSSALRLNVHFHCLVPDGVFGAETNAGAGPSFIRLPPPGDQEVETINRTIARKTLLLLRRLEPSDHALEADTLERIYAAAIQPRRPGFPLPVHRPRCSSIEGFSLHADVHVAAGDRSGLARVCRYGLRPPLAAERLQLLPSPVAGVRYRLKRSAPGGATHRVMTPLEFLGALSSLVPPPRVHLTRYHGIFAPHARDRGAVLAAGSPVAIGPDRPVHDSPRGDPVPSSPDPAAHVTGHAHSCHRSPARPAYRRAWAELMKKVFAIDVFLCDRCGGRRRIVAAITQPDLARAILCCVNVSDAYKPARAPPHSIETSPA